MLTSTTKPDSKHLHDINFAVNALLKMDIPFESITFIIDGDISEINKIIKPCNKKNIKIFNAERTYKIFVRKKGIGY